MKCGDANNPGGAFITSHGKPCGRDVRPGFTRCNLHGAANLTAKIKAEQMLAQARLPACEALYLLIEKYMSATCATCGFPTGDVDEARAIISASKVILDRTGMGPHAVLELTPQRDGPLNLDMLTDGERQDMMAALATIRRLKAAIRERQVSGVTVLDAVPAQLLPNAPDAP